MIFCSLVMAVVLRSAEAERCAPRPLRARPRPLPQPIDTVCQIKFQLLHFRQCAAEGLRRWPKRLIQAVGDIRLGGQLPLPAERLGGEAHQAPLAQSPFETGYG